MSADYWYRWFPQKYALDAGHLDHVADSCYRRLIDFYMIGREPVPKDPVRLMFITRTSPDQFAAIWPRIQHFFIEENGVLHLKKCNEELDHQDRKSRFASVAGARSAEKRKTTSKQLQLLNNDRSTTVQRPFNDPRYIEEKREEKKIDSSAASNVSSVASETLASPDDETRQKEKPNGRGKRGSRISADWQPSEADIKFATEHGILNGEVTAAAAEFRDYWAAASGRYAIKVDWSATWRNRIRDIAKRGQATNRNRSGPNQQRTGSLVTAMRAVMPRNNE